MSHPFRSLFSATLSALTLAACSGEDDSPGSSVSNAPAVTLASEPGLTTTLLAPGQTIATPGGFGGDDAASLPVAASADGRVLVGYDDAASPGTAVVHTSDGTVVRIPDAKIGGVAFTNDGIAALVFDPAEQSERVWAAVLRFGADGSERFRTELFHSPNLDDVGTKGEPGTSRLGYLSETDTLVAYFGHTQRYDDGVRHQGGYLALVDAAGEQEVLNDWFGSHNLDQRLLTDGSRAFVSGLGDAYPEGIFYAVTDRNRIGPVVLHPLASAGNGATNGQLGGIVALGDQVVMPFVTNRSVPQELDAGTWPDIDEAVSDQIRDAASNGTDLGLLVFPRSAPPDDDTNLDAVWLDPDLGEGARLERLKSAPFGEEGLILLVWAEATGSGGFRGESDRTYYSMIVDANGAVARPKTPLDAGIEVTGGDDLVPSSNGGAVWANATTDGIVVVAFNPG